MQISGGKLGLVAIRKSLLAGADPGFPVGGAPTLQGEAPTYTFSQKLHEIKKILVRRGRPPWIRHWLVSEISSDFLTATSLELKFNWETLPLKVCLHVTFIACYSACYFFDADAKQ